MKYLIVPFATLALLSPTSAEIEATTTAGVHSLFIDRGTDLGAEDPFFDLEIVTEGSITESLGWYALLWNGFPSSDAEVGDELDVIFALTTDIDAGSIELGYKAISFSGRGIENEAELFLGLGTEVAGFHFDLVTFYGVAGPAENVTWLEAAIGYGLETSFGTLGLELSSGFQYGGGNEDADPIGGFGFGAITASFEHELTSFATLSPYLTYTQSTNALGGHDGFYGGVSLSLSY